MTIRGHSDSVIMVPTNSIHPMRYASYEHTPPAELGGVHSSATARKSIAGLVPSCTHPTDAVAILVAVGKRDLHCQGRLHALE